MFSEIFSKDRGKSCLSCGDITIDSSLDGAKCIFENLEPKEFLPLAPTLHCLWSSMVGRVDWALLRRVVAQGTRLLLCCLVSACLCVFVCVSLYSNSVFFKNLRLWWEVGKFSKHLSEDALSFGGGWGAGQYLEKFFKLFILYWNIAD